MKVKKFLRQFCKHTVFEVIDSHGEKTAVGEVGDFLETCPESESLKKEIKKVELAKNKKFAGLEGADYPYLVVTVKD